MHHCRLMLGLCLLALCPVARASKSITIMPLGDSITYGVSSDGGGYRTQLYTDLTAAGYGVSFVGSDTRSPSPTLTAAGEVEHEGHPGYRVDDITANLNANAPSGADPNNGGFWLAPGGVQPDVILLHIGTNDIFQDYDPLPEYYPGAFTDHLAARLQTLIQSIVPLRPHAVVMVAGVVPSTDAGAESAIEAYNAAIQNSVVPNDQASGENVYFVDQHSPFFSAGNLTPGLMSNTVHPTQTGYDLMGNTWANAIESLPEPTGLTLLIPCAAILLRRRR